MKSSGVDAWLQHWLKMQRKGKCPLALKEPSDKNRDAIKDWQNLKKSKPGYIEPDKDDEMNINDSISDAAQTNAKGGTDGPLVLKSPHDVASTRTSCRKLLASLSDNLDYKKLLLLLLTTKVRNTLSICALTNGWIGRWTIGGISSGLGIMAIHWSLPFQSIFQSKILFVALGLYTMDQNWSNHCWK